MLSGAVRDLNVMTRRGVYRHRLKLVSGDCIAEGEAVLVCPRGAARITLADGRGVTIYDNDALVLDAARFQSDEPVWLVELIPA